MNGNKMTNKNERNVERIKPEDVKEPGRQFKGILISDDGITFLVTRELYTMVLSTGALIDGKSFQGRKFVLKPTEEEDKKLLMEKEAVRGDE